MLDVQAVYGWQHWVENTYTFGLRTHVPLLNEKSKQLHQLQMFF